ncbi:MAG: pyridoxal-phosphate dependent enzyme [Hyphomicrobiales bacterium]|nr:pyridoxal-phosphate dependent enzyme [Hyphomicrobiales bacterium]
MAIPDISQITLTMMQQRKTELGQATIHTPVVGLLARRLVSHLEGANISLKLECYQHTGTFKARGALSVASAIPVEDRVSGITAVSAGNHAIAAAWAARQLDLSAKVVMQSTANPYRIALAREQGAEIIMKEPGAPSFAEAERLVKDEGRTLIHPFEGPNTTLGAAGVGLEIMTDLDDVEAVVVAVGGGGLIGGVAAAVKTINPDCKVYGVEPAGADSMSQSLASGQPVTLDKIDTIADSLSPPMALPFGFAICQRYVDEVVTVSDDEICAGVVLLQEDAKLAVEPAAGAALAGALGPLRQKLSGKKICILICGANIDTNTYADVTARGRKTVGLLLGK